MKILINLGIILLLITVSMAVTKLVVEATRIPLWMKIWVGLVVILSKGRGNNGK